MIHLILALTLLTQASAQPFPAVEISDRTKTERSTNHSAPGHRVRGYAILVAAMVASAAAASFVSARISPRYKFLSYFVSQASTLGVYVFGAPIWEPLSSGFRKYAFGVDADAGNGGDALETMWRRTQRAYSLNEQMSRNVITSFLVSVRQNFYEARRAVVSNDAGYAVDQIAEAAVRLNRYFADISPRDESVAAAIRAAFTDHVVIDATFRARVLDAIGRLDPNGEDVEGRYEDVLDAWLGDSHNL